jgi:DNA-binding MarR family transcriptional regulator
MRSSSTARCKDVDSPSRTDNQLAVIRTMLYGLDPFFRIRSTMPASAIQAFLLVAEKEGLGVGEYAKKAGISPTTMSRHLLDMGERNRHAEDGAGLVEGRENILNRREKVYHLTPKGRAFLSSITQRVRA